MKTAKRKWAAMVEGRTTGKTPCLPTDPDYTSKIKLQARHKSPLSGQFTVKRGPVELVVAVEDVEETDSEMERGRKPQTITELIPEFLAVVPIDPVSQRPLELSSGD